LKNHKQVSTKRGTSGNKVFWIISAVLLGIVMWAVISSTNENSTTSSEIRIELPEFTSVTPQDDPVADIARDSIKEYQKWLENHPTSDALEGYKPVHAKMAKKLAAHGIMIKEKVDFDSDYYPDIMNPIKVRLDKKGWAADFIAPMMTPDANGNARTIAFCYIAKIIAKKSGTTIGMSGSKIVYDHEIVGDVYSVKVPGYTYSALTDNKRIRQFLPYYVDQAKDVLASIKDDSIDPIQKLQWKFKRGVSDQEAFQVILSDLIESSYQHELQHVKDDVLANSETINRSRMSNEGRVMMKTVIEARGIMGQVAYSKASIYAVSHLRHWCKARDPQFKGAGQIAGGFLDRNEAITNDKSVMEMEQTIRAWGEKGLRKSDPFYNEIVENLQKGDPNPVLTAAKKLGL